MLNWFLGKPGEETRRDNDADEPPETPAPVFAARAIKSAIFGTPAPPPGDTTMAERLADFTNIPNRDMESPSKPQGILMTPGTARTRKTVSFGGGVKDGAAGVREGSKSGIPDDCPGKFPSPWVPKEPSKLGDGDLRRTALTRSLEKVRDTRRKVTEEREGKNRFPSIPDTSIPTRQEEKDAKRRFPSIPDTPILEKTEDREPKQRFSSIPDASALEQATDSDRRPHSRRGPEPDTPGALCALDVATKLTSKQLQEEDNATTDLRKARVAQLIRDASSPETTVDLNEPRSKSGRYWKAEYETYHEDAKTQMKKLIRYKQLAKDYAKKKDEEAIDLAEKLEEEQMRVLLMEEKIQEMVGLATDSRLNGDEESPALMKALARQTALAVQYKSQVDKFRVALENREKERKGRVSSSDEDDGGISAEHHHEDRAMARLREDMERMRVSLTTAEKKVRALSDENAKLSHELARTKEDLLQSEKRREAADERNNDTNKLLEELQKSYNTLKEAAKSQRKDAEHLLKRRSEQVAELKKEIKALQRASRHPAEEPARERSIARLSGELELDDRGKKRRSASAHPSLETAEVIAEAPIRETIRARSSSERHRTTDTTSTRDRADENRRSSSTRATEDAASKPRRSRINLADYLSDARKQRVSSQTHKPNTSVLSEVANTRTARQPRSISPAKRHTTDRSLRERFTTLSNKPGLSNPRDESPVKGSATAGYESPLKPDSETAESTQQVRISSNTAVVGVGAGISHRMRDSPRPSRFNFVQEDTPTPSNIRYSMTERGDGRSRLDDSRLSRTDLDPDRAAAAKARLEMRNKERRRAKEREGSLRGENVRVPA